MTNSKIMSASELAEIMAAELRQLSESEMTDKNIGRKIDKAKQVFNGCGKLIALAALSIEAQRLGQRTDILTFPDEIKKIDSSKK